MPRPFRVVNWNVSQNYGIPTSCLLELCNNQKPHFGFGLSYGKVNGFV